jgi:hypothetical protein
MSSVTVSQTVLSYFPTPWHFLYFFPDRLNCCIVGEMKAKAW